MTDFKTLLGRIAAGETLTEDRARAAFDIMMSGAATAAQTGAFLMGLRVRGETVAEIAGAARAMREKALKISAPPGTVDTCGTGGDGKGTHNVSTAAALIVAGCGVPVAKHGNRAMSSRSGSADVLRALGVNVDAGAEAAERALARAGFGFLMAPRHHAAMRHVAGARVELGTRTIFNLLGPLSNPAGARRQLIGVFDARWLAPLAEVLGRLGAERVWVVHGSDGMDELTVTGPSAVAELKDGAVSRFEIAPEDAGLPRADPAALAGGDPERNAGAVRALLDGERGAFRDIALLNAAAALIVAGRAADLRAGAARAAAAIDDGSARRVLERLRQITVDSGA